MTCHIDTIRARLLAAEGEHDARLHMYRWYKARLAVHESALHDATVDVSELRRELDDAIDRDAIERDAAQWREHVAATKVTP